MENRHTSDEETTIRLKQTGKSRKERTGELVFTGEQIGKRERSLGKTASQNPRIRKEEYPPGGECLLRKSECKLFFWCKVKFLHDEFLCNSSLPSFFKTSS